MKLPSSKAFIACLFEAVLSRLLDGEFALSLVVTDPPAGLPLANGKRHLPDFEDAATPGASLLADSGLVLLLANPIPPSRDSSRLQLVAAAGASSSTEVKPVDGDDVEYRLRDRSCSSPSVEGARRLGDWCGLSWPVLLLGAIGVPEIVVLLLHAR